MRNLDPIECLFYIMRDLVVACAKKARQFANLDDLFLVGLQGIR